MGAMWIHEDDLALLEHSFLNEQNVFDFEPNHFQWYMMGVHDFVDRIMQEMSKKED